MSLRSASDGTAARGERDFPVREPGEGAAGANAHKETADAHRAATDKGAHGVSEEPARPIGDTTAALTSIRADLELPLDRATNALMSIAAEARAPIRLEPTPRPNAPMGPPLSELQPFAKDLEEAREYKKKINLFGEVSRIFTGGIPSNDLLARLARGGRAEGQVSKYADGKTGFRFVDQTRDKQIVVENGYVEGRWQSRVVETTIEGGKSKTKEFPIPTIKTHEPSPVTSDGIRRVVSEQKKVIQLDINEKRARAQTTQKAALGSADPKSSRAVRSAAKNAAQQPEKLEPPSSPHKRPRRVEAENMKSDAQRDPWGIRLVKNYYDYSMGIWDSFTFGLASRFMKNFGGLFAASNTPYATGLWLESDIEGVSLAGVPVDYESGWYHWGERTGTAFEVAAMGLSFGLKALANRANKQVVEAAAKLGKRRFKELKPVKAQIEQFKSQGIKFEVHHRGPLRGHPGVPGHRGGQSALFPTAGLPWHSSSRNLELVATAAHGQRHADLLRLEIFGKTLINPLLTSGRFIRNELSPGYASQPWFIDPE